MDNLFKLELGDSKASNIFSYEIFSQWRNTERLAEWWDQYKETEDVRSSKYKMLDNKKM